MRRYALLGGSACNATLLPSTVPCCTAASRLPVLLFSLDVQALQARGHTVVPVAWSGVVQSILVDPVDDTLMAVSDPRKDGAPAGY